MRWSVALLLLLAGCSDPAPAPTDDVVKTCANTSCVAGASCITRSGETCRCLEDGVWTCGTVARPPGDGGFVFDTGPAFPVPTDTGTAADSGPTRTNSGCTGTMEACGGGEDPIATAEAALRKIMVDCGASCTALTLFATKTCAARIEANVEWTATALDCVAAAVKNYQWRCAAEFHASTLGSCPD